MLLQLERAKHLRQIVRLDSPFRVGDIHLDPCLCMADADADHHRRPA